MNLLERDVAALAPLKERANGLRVGRPRVLITNICGEKFQKAPGGAFAGADDAGRERRKPRPRQLASGNESVILGVRPPAGVMPHNVLRMLHFVLSSAAVWSQVARAKTKTRAKFSMVGCGHLRSDAPSFIQSRDKETAS